MSRAKKHHLSRGDEVRVKELLYRYGILTDEDSERYRVNLANPDGALSELVQAGLDAKSGSADSDIVVSP